jgi:DNA-directed RNA polymerase omega subunit
MSIYQSNEKSIEHADGSIYKLALMVARRARDLAEGEKPFVRDFDRDKPIRAAMEEVEEGFFEIPANKK